MQLLEYYAHYKLTTHSTLYGWGRKMPQIERPVRLQIMLSQREIDALEDWRFERRMPSRAAAVRELLRRGLAAEGFLLADGNIKSQDFGIVGSGNGQGDAN